MTKKNKVGKVGFPFSTKNGKVGLKSLRKFFLVKNCKNPSVPRPQIKSSSMFLWDTFGIENDFYVLFLTLLSKSDTPSLSFAAKKHDFLTQFRKTFDKA